MLVVGPKVGQLDVEHVVSLLHLTLDLAVISPGVFPVELVKELFEDVLEVGVGAFEELTLVHGVLA